MNRLLDISTIDFTLPTSWIGKSLCGEVKIRLENLLKCIKAYIHAPLNEGKWCEILDLIESTKQIGIQNSMAVLEGMVTYLRHKLLSSDTQTIYYTVLLLDVLVKNSGYRVHVLIGRKHFMKTLSVVARRIRLKPGYAYTRVADLIIDCIQAWGEAFTPRRHMYPHIYEAYTKMRYKYGISFLRPHFDPTRVPIFLGPITQPEKILVSEYAEDGVDTNPSASEKDVAEEVDQGSHHEGSHATASESHPNHEAADLMEMQQDLLEFTCEDPSKQGTIGIVHATYEDYHHRQPPPIPCPPFSSEQYVEEFPPPYYTNNSDTVTFAQLREPPLTVPPYLPPPPPVPSTMNSSASAIQQYSSSDMQQNPQPVYLHPSPVPPITGRINCIEKPSSAYHNWRITATRDIELRNTAEPAALPVSTLDEEVQRMMRTKPSRPQHSRPRDEVYFPPAEGSPHWDRKQPICAVVSEDDSNTAAVNRNRYNRNTIQLGPEDTFSAGGNREGSRTIIVSPTQKEQDALTQPSAPIDNRGDGVSVTKKQPRKSAPAFIVPSSAPENEIRYYGTQRVVVTRKSAI